jgi:hypothetical protein
MVVLRCLPYKGEGMRNMKMTSWKNLNRRQKITRAVLITFGIFVLIGIIGNLAGANRSTGRTPPPAAAPTHTSAPAKTVAKVTPLQRCEAAETVVYHAGEDVVTYQANGPQTRAQRRANRLYDAECNTLSKVVLDKAIDWSYAHYEPGTGSVPAPMTTNAALGNCVTALNNTGSNFPDGSLWATVEWHNNFGLVWNEVNDLPACKAMNDLDRTQIINAFLNSGGT